MTWIARAFYEQSKYEEATHWYNQGLAAADNDPEIAAVAWHGLGTIDFKTGDYPSAREKSEKSLLIRQKIGNEKAEASSWHQLGAIDLATGDYPSAREKFEKSLLIWQQIGDKAREAASWHQLGTIDLRTGDYTPARQKFEKSLLIQQQIGNKAGEAASWHQLASIDLQTGDYPAARSKFEKSLLLKQQIGDKAGEAASFFQLGQLARRTKPSHGAVILLAICYLLDRSMGHGDTASDLQALEKAAAESGIEPEDLQQVLSAVAEAHNTDRGWGLIKAAFDEN